MKDGFVLTDQVLNEVAEKLNMRLVDVKQVHEFYIKGLNQEILENPRVGYQLRGLGNLIISRHRVKLRINRALRLFKKTQAVTDVSREDYLLWKIDQNIRRIKMSDNRARLDRKKRKIYDMIITRLDNPKVRSNMSLSQVEESQNQYVRKKRNSKNN